MVPEICAEDLKTEMPLTRLYRHLSCTTISSPNSTGRMSSQNPGHMAALSPFSATCPLCPGQNPTAHLFWLATTKASPQSSWHSRTTDSCHGQY